MSRRPQVDVYPNGIKQQPLVRVDEPVCFEVDSSLQLKFQFIPRLERLLRLGEAAQKEYPHKQLAVTKYIFRPSSRYKDEFEDKPWSTSEWQLGVAVGGATTLNQTSMTAWCCHELESV